MQRLAEIFMLHGFEDNHTFSKLEVVTLAIPTTPLRALLVIADCDGQHNNRTRHECFYTTTKKRIPSTGESVPTGSRRTPSPPYEASSSHPARKAAGNELSAL